MAENPPKLRPQNRDTEKAAAHAKSRSELKDLSAKTTKTPQENLLDDPDLDLEFGEGTREPPIPTLNLEELKAKTSPLTQSQKKLLALIKAQKVSDSQKRDWEKMLYAGIEFPHGTAEVIMFYGSNLDHSAELPLVESSLKTIYPGLKVTVIDNTLPPEKAYEAFSQAAKKSTADVVIPYISGHGATTSAIGDYEKDEFLFFTNNPQKVKESKKDRNPEHYGLRKKLGVTGSQFAAVVNDNPQKKFLFIIDTCYSGSALDDPIAKAPNTYGIIASSWRIERSSQTKKGMGRFTREFFNQIAEGQGLAETFIKADASTQDDSPSSKERSHNPAAFFHFREGEKGIEISSTQQTAESSFA